MSGNMFYHFKWNFVTRPVIIDNFLLESNVIIDNSFR